MNKREKNIIESAYVNAMAQSLLTVDARYNYHDKKMLELLRSLGYSLDKIEYLQKQACKQAYG